MKRRHLLLALLAVLLVLPAATAAMAQTADQTLDVSVLAADVRSIQVESEMGLGVVTPGGSSGERYFSMQITNTYSGTGFEVIVDGPDLTSFTWGEPCNENGCTRIDDDPASTIAKTNLFVQGGTLGWDPEPMTAYGDYLSGSPLMILEATADAYGGMDLADPPFVRLDVPGEADLADYYTTLTYTIQAPTS